MWKFAFLCFQYSVFCFWNFDYNVSHSGSLSFHLTWNSLRFLNVYIHVFNKIWKYSAIISCNMFSLVSFCPLQGLPQCLCWLAWWCSMGPLGFVHVPLIFSSCSSYSIISLFLSSNLLILSSACSNLLLNPFSEIFTLISALSSFRISLWLLFKVFYVYWYFHFVHTPLAWLSPYHPLILWAPTYKTVV